MITRFYIYRLFCFVFLVLIALPFFTFAQGNESWKLYDDSQVAIIEIAMDQAALDWMYQPLDLSSDSLHLAQVHFKTAFIDEIIDSVGIRLRGNTSRDAQKKSFKLDFNRYMRGREFYDVESLNLNGEHNDPSIIRSKLCWDFFEKIGLTASRAAHAAVYINGKYYGLYISVEHIDDQFLKNHFADDSGNLWKCLWPADLTYRGSSPGNYYPYQDGNRPYELTTNEEQFDYTQLARLISIINKTPNNALPDSLEAILAVPEVLKYFAVDVLTGSWDDYWSLMNNYYLYFEPAAGKFHWLPYDYDNTFGVDWFNIDWAQANPYDFPKVGDGPRPLAERLMGNAEYRNLYTHFLDYYRQNVFLLYHWDAHLDSLKAMIAPFAKADTYRSKDYGFTLEDFHDSYSSSHYENKHIKRGVKEFAIFRSNYLLGQLKWVDAKPIVYHLDWTPRFPDINDTIYVSASAFSKTGLKEVTINFHAGAQSGLQTFAMKFAPHDGSTRVEDADRWTGKITPIGQAGFGSFEISAKDIYGRVMTYPRETLVTITTRQQLTSGLAINEFLAKNDNANTDPAGQHDDWLELYNPTANSIDLGGLFLTDDSSDWTQWRFPHGAKIEAGEFLLVWCDNDTNQAGLHANFKLAQEGEFIALVSADGHTVFDSISFGAQTPDISFGRYPDGSEQWLPMPPSPQKSNSLTAIDNENVPLNFELTIYPNPFNQAVTIAYYLDRPIPVTIEICDVLGRRVWMQDFGRQNLGRQQIRWNGKGQTGATISSGLYICLLKAGSNVHKRKLLLIK